MTDREVLDLVLEKVSSTANKVSGIEGKVSVIENKVSSLEQDVAELKSQVVKLEDMDRMILDEVDRVHGILDKHKEDRAAHSA